MIDETDGEKISTSRSFYSTIHPKVSSQNAWKSDMYIPSQLNNLADQCSRAHKVSTKDCCGEYYSYYKKYEHDELPVKDYEGTGDKNRSMTLTDSQLDNLETKIMKNISHELKTDNTSYMSLDNNIKIFKTTCQQIFDTFYATMQDIELYKEKFQNILEKNKADSTEMEEFIKEMIQHIISTESVLNEKSKSDENDEKADDTTTVSKESLPSQSYELLHSVVEAYKNDSYSTDSNTDENTSKAKHALKTSEVFNIYLLSNTPCVEIRMNERNMLSEINIKNPNHSVDTQAASAENLRKLATKKKEMEGHSEERHEVEGPEVEIPIKVSSAKKNIYLNEDFSCNREKPERSFLSRICGFFCKRFRKST